MTLPKLNKKWFLRTLPILLALAIGIGGTVAFFHFKPFQNISDDNKKDKYISFSLEVFDKIQENYWDNISDQQLAELFQKATEKQALLPQTLKETNKQGVEKMLENHLKSLPTDEQKKEFVTQVTDIVLANLSPFGRSRLYSQAQEKDLRDTVKNTAPTDHYQALGVDKDATPEQIEQAYQQKEAKLAQKAKTDEQAAQELAQAQEAKKVLADSGSRQIFDQHGVNPTVQTRVVNNKAFYLHLDKFSPTSLEDINREAEKLSNSPSSIDTFIFDLRDNIGGAIDGLPYFLGPFIGNDNYAYQLFHQGEKTDYKTKIGWLPSLVRYKKVVILINENSQSTAEVMAAVLKKYNVGILVGTKTKGWGTVENIFKLDNQLSEDETYSLFLVHSLTLREDGNPIQDNGVTPLVDIADPNWSQELYSYLPDPQLVEAVKQVI
jgi:hypothetical protein